MPVSRRLFLGGSLATAAAALAAPRALSAQPHVHVVDDPLLAAILAEMADTVNAVKRAGAFVHVEHLQRAAGHFRLLRAYAQQHFDAPLQQRLQQTSRPTLLLAQLDRPRAIAELQAIGMHTTGVDLPENWALDTKERVIAQLRASGVSGYFDRAGQGFDQAIQAATKRGLVSLPVVPLPRLRTVQASNADCLMGWDVLIDEMAFAAAIACLAPTDPLCAAFLASWGSLIALKYLMCF